MAGHGSVLITGATGTVGSGLVQALRSKDVEVRALVRDPAKAEALRSQGVEVVAGDLDRPESLEEAVQDVAKIFLITWNGPSAPLHAHNVIEAAKRTGRPHIVRQGAYGSERSRIVRDHEAIDEELAASGLPVTILKPTWFMQNAMMAASTVASSGVIWMPFKDGRVGMIDIRDIVDVAVEVLTGRGHEGKRYVLTGPASVSFHDVARALSGALDKPVAYVNVPPEVARQGFLDAGFPEWIADGYLELIADFADDWGDTVSPDVERLLGRPGRSLDAFARDFAPIFGGVAQPA
ncbi:MAG: SDR family oxidoreductase [Deinococcales bacterium]